MDAKRRNDFMKKMLIVLLAVAPLAACTTAEKTVSGAGAGAAIGAIATGGVGGAVVGAAIGGFGGGNCQYRNSRGQIYTARCHWL